MDMGELNAKVTARALATSFCALIPASSNSRTNSRADLRSMKEEGHVWPLPADLDPSRIPGLAKAIANNFVQKSFKTEGPFLVCSEPRRVAAAVSVFTHSRSFWVFVTSGTYFLFLLAELRPYRGEDPRSDGGSLGGPSGRRFFGSIHRV